MDRSSEHQPLLSSEYPGAAAEALPPASSSSSGGVMSSVDLARQRAADEALARQLQDQERADPSYQEAEGHTHTDGHAREAACCWLGWPWSDLAAACAGCWCQRVASWRRPSSVASSRMLALKFATRC